MIATFVVILLGLAAVWFIAQPLLSGPRIEPDERSIPQSEADERKRVALGAILDLEEERDSGKLSANDFDSLRLTYEAEAVAAIKDLDEIRPDGEDALEAEIARIRRRMDS